MQTFPDLAGQNRGSSDTMRDAKIPLSATANGLVAGVPVRAGRNTKPAENCRRICICQSIAEVPRASWERMLAGEPDSWDFHRAVEAVPPPGFKLGAIAAIDRGAVVAAAPLFRIDYRLDTPIQGRMRPACDWIYSRWPRLISRRVMGIGSPLSDSCSIGFAPELEPEQR